MGVFHGYSFTTESFSTPCVLITINRALYICGK